MRSDVFGLVEVDLGGTDEEVLVGGQHLKPNAVIGLAAIGNDRPALDIAVA